VKQISFALTKAQIRNRSKTVTRRLGWKTLQPGELLQGIEQGQGLPKGARVKKLAVVRVVNVRQERLEAIAWEPNGTAREGFPEMRPDAFIRMFCQTHKPCLPETLVTRIEFEYVDVAEAKAS